MRILLSKSNPDLASNGASACENAGAHEAVPETQDDIEECSSDSSGAHAHAGGATSAEGAGLDDLGDGMDITYLHGDQYRRMQLSATILLDSLPPGAEAALDAPEGWRNGRCSELDLQEWVGALKSYVDLAQDSEAVATDSQESEAVGGAVGHAAGRGTPEVGGKRARERAFTPEVEGGAEKRAPALVRQLSTSGMVHGVADPNLMRDAPAGELRRGRSSVSVPEAAAPVGAQGASKGGGVGGAVRPPAVASNKD